MVQRLQPLRLRGVTKAARDTTLDDQTSRRHVERDSVLKANALIVFHDNLLIRS